MAASYPNFPIIAEALRECLNDVFDLEPLRQLMRDIASRRIRVVEVDTPNPSPFASSLLFGYTGAFMYDYDQPLAERAAAANWVDPELLASLLGSGPGEIADEASFAAVEADLQRVTPSRRATTLEAFWDLLRELGPLTPEECAERCALDPADWLESLDASGRILRLRVAGADMVAVAQDGPLLESLADQESGRRLVRRWLRHHSVVTPGAIVARYGLDPDLVSSYLAELADQSAVRAGRFIDQPGPQYVDLGVLERVRRRTLKRLRSQIEPVEPRRFAAFLVDWQEADRPGRGLDQLAEAVEQLAGYPLPASMLESVVLPSRVGDYQPAMLDQLMAASEVVWTGHGALGDRDGWVCLWPGDMAPLTAEPPAVDLTAEARRLEERLTAGGAWTIDDLAGEDSPPAQVEAAIWELVWAGLVSCDTLAPLRGLVQPASALRRPHPPRARRVRRPLMAPRMGRTGRWFALPPAAMTATERLVEALRLELARYGVLTRGSLLSEAMTPSFFDAYRVLSVMEGQAVVRRGYFVDGLGAAQFALTGAVDRLREEVHPGLVLLAACDPANPWGAALAWPESMGHRPTRKAGAIVVLDDGQPVIYLERGVHTLVTFSDQPAPVVAALRLVGEWVDRGRFDKITLTRINGESVFEAHQWSDAFEQAGFTLTPQGFRRRAVQLSDPPI